MKRLNKKGITLLELIIVIVIIAIGAVLIPPNMGAWIQNYRLRSATRDIVSVMRTAQMRAVSLNSEFRVSFDINGRNYILQRNSGGLWIDEGELQNLPPGIVFDNCTFPLKDGKRNAEFNPNSTSSSGSLTLKNTKGSTRRITLTSATGRIRIQE